jgi:hypothetical protein
MVFECMNNEAILAHCIFCHRKTRHDLQHEEKDLWESDDGHFWEETIYQLIRCRGCGSLSVRELSTDVIKTGREGEQAYDEKLYPPRAAARERMGYAHDLPDPVKRIYGEVVNAMNAELALLSAIGLRTLIEAICHDQKAKGKNLERLIDSMAELGVLSKKQADILHSHRFLGNVAAHEITAPQPAELIAAIEIAETILKTLYVIPKLEKDIKTGRVVPKPSMKLNLKGTADGPTTTPPS